MSLVSHDSARNTISERQSVGPKKDERFYKKTLVDSMLPRAHATAARTLGTRSHRTLTSSARDAVDADADAATQRLRAAVEGAACVAASADTAYLERDPADRPPPSAFYAFYARAAVAALDAALAGVSADAADASAAVARADAMLARDRLAPGLARSGGGGGEWPE